MGVGTGYGWISIEVCVLASTDYPAFRSPACE